MPKYTYKATFSNGITKTRTSNRIYTHAWMVYSDDQTFMETGFSSNRNLAVKAAYCCASHRRNRNRIGECHDEIVEVTV